MSDNDKTGGQLKNKKKTKNTSLRDLEEDLKSHLSMSVELGKPKDDYRNFMSKNEREFIAKIMMSQVASENPYLDDFYYQAFAKKQVEKQDHGDKSDFPAYIPLPKVNENFKKKPKSPLNLDNALGKISSHSVRNPKPMIDVSAEMKKETFSALTQTRIVFLIGKVYRLVISHEDLLAQDDAKVDAHDALREISQKVFDALNLETDFYVLVQFLKYSKGKKIVPRVLKIFSEAQKMMFLEKLVASFEYLDFMMENSDKSNVDLFINSVLAHLIPFVSGLDFNVISALLSALLSKTSAYWIFMNKAGIVFVSVFMSRLEMLKTDSNLTFQPLVDQIFASLQGNFASLFKNNDAEFYVWQFLALLALNSSLDQKRTLVLELREIILRTVKSDNEPLIANMNVFLNALGIDASQLGK